MRSVFVVFKGRVLLILFRFLNIEELLFLYLQHPKLLSLLINNGSHLGRRIAVLIPHHDLMMVGRARWMSVPHCVRLHVGRKERELRIVGCLVLAHLYYYNQSYSQASLF